MQISGELHIIRSGFYFFLSAIWDHDTYNFLGVLVWVPSPRGECSNPAHEWSKHAALSANRSLARVRGQTATCQWNITVDLRHCKKQPRLDIGMFGGNIPQGRGRRLSQASTRECLTSRGTAAVGLARFALCFSQNLSHWRGGCSAQELCCSGCSRTRCRDTCVTVFGSSTV